MSDKILVPLDGSPTATRVIEGIIREQHRLFGEMTLLHVLDEDKLNYRMIPDFQVEMIREHARKAARQILETHRDTLARGGVTAELRLASGSPRQIVCRIAKEESFNLLILGRRGSGEIRDMLFGSVANYALHNVSCPVLLF
jgi:nucleotide-binding universal stress UspA family protein